MDRLKKSINAAKEKAAAAASGKIDLFSSGNNKVEDSGSSPIVILEYMRHEFFTSCQKDDAERAYELYTMPYENCVMLHQQQEAEEDIMDKLKENITKEFKLFKSKLSTNNNTTPLPEKSQQYSSSAKNTEESGFLEQRMHPCEFFSLSYFHSYLMMMNSNNNNNSNNAAALANKFKEKVMSISSNANQTVVSRAASAPPTTTTTPLHEAARLGYPPLLKRMMQLPNLDLSVKDWKQRTVLHYICGGVTTETSSATNKEVGLKSFYKSAMDQKQQKEAEKREKLVQMLRKLDITTKLTNTTSTTDSDPVTTNDSSFWSKIQEKVASSLSSSDNYPMPPSYDNSTTLTTTHNTDIHVSSDNTDCGDISIPHPSLEESNRLECLSLILSSSHIHYVGMNTVDCRIRTALHYAASLERFHLVKLLLKRPNILVTIVDEQGRTSCDLSSTPHVQSILEAKALFNCEDCHDEEAEETNKIRRDSTLATPFCWFESFRDDDITRLEQERQFLLDTARDQIQLYYRHTKNDTPPNFTNAQYTVLLETYNWSVDALMLAIQKEEEEQKSEQNAVIYNENIISLAPRESINDSPAPEAIEQVATNTISKECLICYSTVDGSSTSWTNLDHSCHHGFCTSCLQEYISTTFVNPTTRSSAPTTRIPCPQYDCHMLIPESTLISLLSSDHYDKLKQGELELFVLSCKMLKFCPHPGCKGIVKATPPMELKARYGEDCMSYVGAVCTACSSSSTDETLTYEGVKVESNTLYSFTSSLTETYKPHRFCFSCSSSTPHWPASCNYMEKWKVAIEDNLKGLGGSNPNNFEDVAHHLWLKANTRPCPKCKTAIEKNDGCNHMTCSNRQCRHEFCWICRKEWSLHSSKTGGYFLCNRWKEDDEPTDEFVMPIPPPSSTYSNPTEGQSAANAQQDLPTNSVARSLTSNTYGTSLHAARTAREDAKLMARFIFYYGRWTAQKESSILETKMASTLRLRLKMMTIFALKESEDIGLELGTLGISFVNDAFTELLECRSFLQHSYAHAYFRFASLSGGENDSNREIEKLSLEHWQSELEMIVEQLSNAVARSHLRASRSQIIHLTRAAAQIRKEFSMHAISVWHEERLSEERRRRQQQTISGFNAIQEEESLSPTETRNPLVAEAVANRQTTEIEDYSSVSDVHDLLDRMMELGRNLEDVGDGANASSEEQSSSREYLDVFSQAEEDVHLQRALEASILDTLEERNDDTTFWTCPSCTFQNTSSSTAGEQNCAMCDTTRQQS